MIEAESQNKIMTMSIARSIGYSFFCSEKEHCVWDNMHMQMSVCEKEREEKVCFSEIWKIKHDEKG